MYREWIYDSFLQAHCTSRCKASMQTNALRGLGKRGGRVRGHIFIGEVEKCIVSSIPDVSVLLLTCQSFLSKELCGSKMIQFKQTSEQVCHIIWVNQYKWKTIRNCIWMSKQSIKRQEFMHLQLYRDSQDQFSIKRIPNNFQKTVKFLLITQELKENKALGQTSFLMHVSYSSETVFLPALLSASIIFLPALSGAPWALRTLHLHGRSRKSSPSLGAGLHLPAFSSDIWRQFIWLPPMLQEAHSTETVLGNHGIPENSDFSEPDNHSVNLLLDKELTNGIVTNRQRTIVTNVLMNKPAKIIL